MALYEGEGRTDTKRCLKKLLARRCRGRRCATARGTGGGTSWIFPLFLSFPPRSGYTAGTGGGGGRRIVGVEDLARGELEVVGIDLRGE